MLSNEDHSSNDTSKHLDSTPKTKKTVDEYFEEFKSNTNSRDNWARIADELDVTEPHFFDRSFPSRNPDGNNSNDSFFRPNISHLDDDMKTDKANRHSTQHPDSYERQSYRIENQLGNNRKVRSSEHTHSERNQGEWTNRRHGRFQRQSEQSNDKYLLNNRFEKESRFNGHRPDQRFNRSFGKKYRNGNSNEYTQEVYGQSQSEIPRNFNNNTNIRDGGVNGIGRNNEQHFERRHNSNFRPSSFREGRKQCLPCNNRRDSFRGQNDYRQCRSVTNDYRAQSASYRSNDCREIRNSNREDFVSDNWRRIEYGEGYYNNQYRSSRYREKLEPTIGAIGKKGEPLSLAEELSVRQYKRPNSDKNRYVGNNTEIQNAVSNETAKVDNRSETDNSIGGNASLEIVELEKMTSQQLIAEARQQKLETIDGEHRRDLIVRVLRARLLKNGLMIGEGTLEILPDEFGFLRSPNSNYLSCSDDIYISPSQIRRFGLRNGLTISGQIRPPKERERYFALLRVESINGEDPNTLVTKPYFDDLVVARPSKRLRFERLPKFKLEESIDSKEITDVPNEVVCSNLRVIDLVSPLAFGQRALMIGPPRSGKTILVREMAKSILANYPNTFVFVVMVDKCPEEVVEMRKLLCCSRCEVVGSTFDEAPIRHIQVSELSFEKAKRMVEYGRDVVVIFDSLTRIIHAWNAERTTSLIGFNGVFDSMVIQRPKRLFSSARQIDGGGSLTTIGTLQLERDERFDKIYEEFKNVCNTVIWLDPSILGEHISMTVVPNLCSYRDIKDFFPEEEYDQNHKLNRRLASMDKLACAQFLSNKLQDTESNEELLHSLDT